jgi:hypothetical protein
MSQAKHADSTPRLHITSVSYAEDDELVALGERFVELRREFLDLARGEYNEAACDRAALLGKAKRHVAMEMAELVATTERGRRAKGLVLLAASHRNPAGGLAWNSLCERMGQSLAMDLLGPDAAAVLL